MVAYVKIGTCAGGCVRSVVLSRPFLSHAVQMVGVFASVKALDPLRPLILAVIALIFI